MVRSNDRFLNGRDIRLIDAANEQKGIVPLQTALRMASDEGFDLVLVADQADPPVCRIMNYGKFLYEKKRQSKEQKKKSAAHKSKEIKFHPNIDAHDYQIKVRHIREFLEKGYRVKVSLFFRGREFKNKEVGMNLMQTVVKDLAGIGTAESDPKMVGRSIIMLMSPTSK